jgi:hypothetical protein
MAKKYHAEKHHVTPEECEHYCGVWYGLASSGWASATAHWEGTPDNEKLTEWREGAMALWTGGSHGYGHCAIGDPEGPAKTGKCAGCDIFSTDYPTTGLVGHTSHKTITSAWGLAWKGWAKPYFPNAIFLNGTWANGTGFGIPK